MDSQGAKATPKTLGDLPLELVERIVDFLDVEEKPSSRSIRQEPSSAIIYSDTQPLKCLSTTCRSLRKLTMDKLFKFMVLKMYAQMDIQMDPYRRTEIKEFMNFVARNRLHLRVQSVVVQFILQTSMGQIDLNEGFAGHVCSQIMDLLEPETLTIVTPPSIMPYLAADGYLGPDQADDWAFDTPLHVLTCTRPSKLPTSETGWIMSRQQGSWEGPWSSITLNEGSSIKVYSSYEYYLKRTPSLFRSRSFQRLIRWNWSSTLRSFEYIAIFPIAPHIHEAFRILRSLDLLEVLSVQFAPHGSSDIISDNERIGKCQISDLWMEFYDCYVEALRFVSEMSNNFQMKMFRSLDWSDYCTREMIKPELEEYLQDWTLDGNCWTKPIEQ